MRVMVAGASGVLNRCGSAPHGRSSPVVEALVELERQTRDAGGLVLRMGHLYGRGTIYAPVACWQINAARMLRRPIGASAH